MFELIQVSKNSFYIQSPSKIGLVRLNDTHVCLIDSGSDKEAGRKVRQILDANSWQLTAIFNTHSNADHIGGNKYLQGQTGIKSMHRALNALLQATLFWNRLFCTAVSRRRICAANF